MKCFKICLTFLAIYFFIFARKTKKESKDMAIFETFHQAHLMKHKLLISEECVYVYITYLEEMLLGLKNS